MDSPARHRTSEVSLSLLAFRHEETGILFEVSAPEILGTFTWRGVQSIAAGVLAMLQARTGKGGSFWFEPVENVNPAGQADIVLRLWFVLEKGVPSELDRAAVRRSLRSAETRTASKGQQPISEGAHPSLVLTKGEINQVWLLDPPDVVAPFLVWNDMNDELEILGARQSCVDEADLLGCARNVLLVCPDDSVLRT